MAACAVRGVAADTRVTLQLLAWDTGANMSEYLQVLRALCHGGPPLRTTAPLYVASDSRAVARALAEQCPAGRVLSGGQRKRVALAQMLIRDPEILLMDEPFGPLDAQTRQIMGNLLLDLWSRDRKALIFVTHDLEEAIALSDRVVVMSAGPAAGIVADYRVPLPRPRGFGTLPGVTTALGAAAGAAAGAARPVACGRGSGTFATSAPGAQIAER